MSASTRRGLALMPQLLACLVGLTIIAGPALSADAQLESARRCTQIKDSLERLVCFDKAFAAAAAPAAPIVAAAPTPAPAPAATPALGDEQVKRPEGKQDESPLEVDATVTAMKGLPGDLARITLDNGQVWEQLQASVRFDVRVGDTVRIKKGALGSYRMSRVSRGASGWVAARRLQ
jgi:hypothetical protein